MPDRPPRLLILTDDASPRGDGMDLRLFAGRLMDRGLSVRILCEQSGGNLPGALIRETPGICAPWRHFWVMRGLRREDVVSPDTVMLVPKRELAESALSVAERWRIPYLLTVEDYLGPGEKLRLSRKWCRGLVAANEELATDLIRQVGVPPRMVHVIHPGVGEVPEVTRRPRCVESRVSVVGTAGPMTFGAGFGTFLSAARRVIDAGHDVEFVIAGEGEDEQELRRRAERLRIADRVTFSEESSPKDAVWSVLDVYCQPSVVPTVGRGLRLAMAQGVPSIASDIEGLRTLIAPDVTGLRVPPNDTNALARAMIDLLESPVRAFTLGEAGQERIRREYDPDREVDAILSLTDQCLAASMTSVGEARSRQIS